MSNVIAALALKSRFETGEKAPNLVLEAREVSARGLVAIGPSVLAIAHVLALEGLGCHDEVRPILEAALRDLDTTVAELGDWGPTYLERGLCVAELRELARNRGVA